MMKYDDEGRVMVSAHVTNPDRIVDADGDTYALAAEDYIDFFAAGARYTRVDANGLLVTEYLRRYGDLDTYLRFTADRLRVVIGGADILDTTPTTVIFNPAEADVDFRIAAVGATNAFFVQGSDGKAAFGCADVPHGGIGAALLALEGANASVNGPHVQFTTTTNDYPLMQLFNYGHDNMGIYFDAYWDGADKSSDAGSNFRIHKIGDFLKFEYDSGIVAGNTVTWNTDGIVLDTSGRVGHRIVPLSDLCIKQTVDDGLGGIHLRESTTDDTWNIVIGGDESLYFQYANDASGADAPGDFAPTVRFLADGTIDLIGSVYAAGVIVDTGTVSIRVAGVVYKFLVAV